MKLPVLSGPGPKILLIAVLSMAFLIPLELVRDLGREREQQQNHALADTAASWGFDGRVAPPFLAIPWTSLSTASNGTTVETRETMFWGADQARIHAVLVPEIRQKGIFPIPLFKVQVTVDAAYQKPDFAKVTGRVGYIDWKHAELVVSMGSLSSYTRKPEALWEGMPLAFDTSAASRTVDGNYFAATIDLSAWQTGSRGLSLSTEIKASRSLNFIPMANQTQVKVESTWPSPSFRGAALPDTRTLGPEGFAAEWTSNSWSPLLQLASLETRVPDEDSMRYGLVDDDRNKGTFGVGLFQPVNVYQLTHRSLEYGILLIILPFVALFLYETITRHRIHPVQYALIGLANTIFYLLLLSISEHSSFGLAYFLASLAVTLLVAWYLGQSLRRVSASLVIGPILAILYAFMYFALNSEDYALLIGSIGLFTIVAGIMVLTRRFNWYRQGGRLETPVPD